MFLFISQLNFLVHTKGMLSIRSLILKQLNLIFQLLQLSLHFFSKLIQLFIHPLLNFRLDCRRNLNYILILRHTYNRFFGFYLSSCLSCLNIFLFLLRLANYLIISRRRKLCSGFRGLCFCDCFILISFIIFGKSYWFWVIIGA